MVPLSGEVLLDASPLPQMSIAPAVLPVYSSEQAGGVLLMDVEIRKQVLGLFPPLQAMHWLHGLHIKLDLLCATHGVTKLQSFGPMYAVSSSTGSAPGSCSQQLLAFAWEAYAIIREHALPDGTSVSARGALHAGTLLEGVLGVLCLRYGVYGQVLLVAEKLLATCPGGMLQLSTTAYELLTEPPECHRAVCMDGPHSWTTCLLQVDSEAARTSLCSDAFMSEEEQLLKTPVAVAALGKASGAHKGAAHMGGGLAGLWNRFQESVDLPASGLYELWSCSEGSEEDEPGNMTRAMSMRPEEQCTSGDEATFRHRGAALAARRQAQHADSIKLKDSIFYGALALLDAGQWMMGSWSQSKQQPLQYALLLLYVLHLVLCVCAAMRRFSFTNRFRALLLLGSSSPLLVASAQVVLHYTHNVPPSQRMALLTVLQTVVVNAIPVCLGVPVPPTIAAVYVSNNLANSGSAITALLLKEAQLEVPWQLLQACLPHLLMTVVAPLLFWSNLHRNAVTSKRCYVKQS